MKRLRRVHRKTKKSSDITRQICCERRHFWTGRMRSIWKPLKTWTRVFKCAIPIIKHGRAGLTFASRATWSARTQNTGHVMQCNSFLKHSSTRVIRASWLWAMHSSSCTSTNNSSLKTWSRFYKNYQSHSYSCGCRTWSQQSSRVSPLNLSSTARVIKMVTVIMEQTTTAWTTITQTWRTTMTQILVSSKSSPAS